MEKKAKIIIGIVAVLIVCISLYSWNEKRKQREMIDQAFGSPVELEFKQTEKSKEETRVAAAKYAIKLQEDSIKFWRKMSSNNNSDDNQAELNRALDKLERLKESENNRRKQWSMKTEF